MDREKEGKKEKKERKRGGRERGSASRKAARGRLSRRLSLGSMMAFARAGAKLERINPRRRRCLIEPPAGLEGIIVHVRECSRYGTGAIVPGTRTCGTEIYYIPEIRAINSFDPLPPPLCRHRASSLSPLPLPGLSANPLFPVRSVAPGLLSCGRGILEDECPTTGLCGFSRHS